MAKAAAAATVCWFTRVFPSSEADDEIHTAGRESRDQQLNSHIIIWNYCFGLIEVPVEAASSKFWEKCRLWLLLHIYLLQVYHLYLWLNKHFNYDI